MLIQVRHRREICLKVRKVDQTHNAWIFFFWEPRFKFIQTAVVPKAADSDAAEAVYESVWVNFTERARERDWMAGNPHFA